MILLLSLALALLSASKVTVQGKFTRKAGKSELDLYFFNGGVFLIISLLSLGLGIDKISAPTLICGIIFGILSTLFQSFYMKAMSTGPVSLAVIISNCAIFIPIIFCTVVYGDELGIFKIIGLVLLVSALFLMMSKKDESAASKKWVFFILVVFFSNGFAYVVMRIHGHSEAMLESAGFLLVSYLSAAVCSFLVCGVEWARGRRLSYKPLSKSALPYILFTALILGAYQYLNLYVTRTFESTIAYPLNCMTTMLVSTLFGVVLFRDRLTRVNVIGIVFGITAIIFTYI